MKINFITTRSFRSPVTGLVDYINSCEDTGVTAGLVYSASAIQDDTAIVVRYGNTGSRHLEERFTVLNHADCIDQSCQKFHALDRMAAAGIPVVPHALVHTYLTIPEAKESIGHPVIGRRFKHFGGKDLRLVTKIKNLPVNRRYPRLSSDYVLKFIPHTKEYRVWTFNTCNHYDRGRMVVIKTAEKIDNGTIDRHTQNLRDRTVKNRHNGYVYQHHDQIPEAARDLGTRATSVFGLDFAAVDIMEDLDAGTFYVLEVNTAPGMSSPSSIRLLGERFIRTAQYHA